MLRSERRILTCQRECLATLATVAVGGLAVAAAVATGPTIGRLNAAVELVSGSLSTWLGGAATVLPVGYAFGAGMVAAVNPCGFALLPAYLGLYLGAAEARPLAGRLSRALWVSATVTVGFVLLFGAMGLVLSLATSAIARHLPWVGLGIGVLLLLAGGRLLAGGSLYASLGERVAETLGGRAQQAGTRGYFAYGLAYGMASLSCTLPIFLTVVAGSLTAQGFAGAAIQFVFYGLGMGLVITSLTLGAALFKVVAIGKLRGLSRYLQPASAVLLLLAGAYLIYYWLTLGGLLLSLGPVVPLAPGAAR